MESEIMIEFCQGQSISAEVFTRTPSRYQLQHYDLERPKADNDFERQVGQLTPGTAPQTSTAPRESVSGTASSMSRFRRYSSSSVKAENPKVPNKQEC